MKRKLETELIAWKKQEEHLPVLLRGPGRLERTIWLSILEKNTSTMLLWLILRGSRNSSWPLKIADLKRSSKTLMPRFF